MSFKITTKYEELEVTQIKHDQDLRMFVLSCSVLAYAKGFIVYNS